MTEVRMHVWTCNHYLYTTRPTSIHTILLLLIPLQPILLQRVVVHMSRDDRGTDAVHAYAHIKSRPEDALPKMKGCSLVPCFPDPGSCRPKRLCHARNYYNPARSAQYSSHSRSQLFAHSRPLLRAPSRSRCAWDSGTETWPDLRTEATMTPCDDHHRLDHIRLDLTRLGRGMSTWVDFKRLQKFKSCDKFAWTLCIASVMLDCIMYMYSKLTTCSV